MQRVKKGFSLVEFMLLLAVIAIAISLLLPHLMRLRAYYVVSKCEANLKTITVALREYSQDAQGKFPRKLNKLTPEYLKVLPSCPSSGLGYQYVYTHMPDKYTLWCDGVRAHDLGGQTTGYPQYNSEKGPVKK